MARNTVGLFVHQSVRAAIENANISFINFLDPAIEEI